MFPYNSPDEERKAGIRPKQADLHKRYGYFDEKTLTIVGIRKFAKI